MTPVRQTIFVATSANGRGNCMQACLASLLDLPLDAVVDTASDESREDWYGTINGFLAGHGLKIEIALPEDPVLEGSYSVGCGPSPRGPFRHAVVCKNGRMVFDPHPSDDGVKWFSRHEILVPLSETEKREAALGMLPEPNLSLYA